MVKRKPINDTVERVVALRSTGMTYSQIAEAVGVSRQRVGQICGKSDKTKFHQINPASVKYGGLRDWMNENYFSMAELCRRMYGYYAPSALNCLTNRTTGKVDMRKSDIDKLIEITGLSYEELFN